MKFWKTGVYDTCWVQLPPPAGRQHQRNKLWLKFYDLSVTHDRPTQDNRSRKIQTASQLRLVELQKTSSEPSFWLLHVSPWRKKRGGWLVFKMGLVYVEATGDVIR